MEYSKVIAIDGPSGSGKSTVARELAQVLDVLYIDTGAMFRALAFEADKRSVPFEWSGGLKEFIESIDLKYGTSSECLISINGDNLTQKIREHHVSKLASIISQIPEIREFLLDFQRNLAKSSVCVMEGRDIGTVVFPNAFCKFFVTASVEVRSQRRLEQLRESGDTSVSLEQIMKDVEKRDMSDMNREVAPLKQASDAELVDTGNMNINDVVSQLKEKAILKAKSVGIEL
ncbi:cytidylate kinase [Bacteriovorax sp. BSW11_IV]|uniref:(d)CMP kinase n=1 Tax=Bacteriovorax sp. BSW11_IV TaxID=1353529 RepID=UPI000389E430|nr:(d)CMP kinase [Bacteriovorax sp. BSW11_IV]EQC48180.1 cytidylate kinase [Bacteriovorax sp. BSW11_IV]